ncbi:TPA: DUF4960 domain-containing protein [Candidatus Poribacteria bacterium]|nr:DUF4960 domain-containing protein [Candidatus Poribacteria bacterium]
MRRVILLSALLIIVTTLSFGEGFKVAFIGGQEAFGEHDKPAYEWAKDELNATLLDPADIPKVDLTGFVVLWWHEGDNDPGTMDEEVKKAILDYLEKGGTLLLSAAAEKYASDLGIEKGMFRIYGPGSDNQEAGVTVREDTKDHPVWEGFDRTPGTKIKTTSVGYPKSADYWPSKFVNAKTVGDCWETGSDWGDTVGAFVEWKVGDGLVFGMGWRIPHWKEDNKERTTLEKLTMNVLNYLAENSAFLSVEPKDKSPIMWGRIKTSF